MLGDFNRAPFSKVQPIAQCVANLEDGHRAVDLGGVRAFAATVSQPGRNDQSQHSISKFFGLCSASPCDRFELGADRLSGTRTYLSRSFFAFTALRTSLRKARSFSRRSARLAELNASSACSLRQRLKRAGSRLPSSIAAWTAQPGSVS